MVLTFRLYQSPLPPPPIPPVLEGLIRHRSRLQQRLATRPRETAHLHFIRLSPCRKVAIQSFFSSLPPLFSGRRIRSRSGLRRGLTARAGQAAGRSPSSPPPPLSSAYLESRTTTPRHVSCCSIAPPGPCLSHRFTLTFLHALLYPHTHVLAFRLRIFPTPPLIDGIASTITPTRL